MRARRRRSSIWRGASRRARFRCSTGRRPDSWWRWRRRGRSCASTTATAAWSAAACTTAGAARCVRRRRWPICWPAVRPRRWPIGCWRPNSARLARHPRGGDGVHHPDRVGLGDEGARRRRGDAASSPRRRGRLRPAPTLDDLFGGPVTTTRPGLPASGGVLHEHVGLVVEGTFASPDYLSATPGQMGMFDDGMTVKSVDAVPFMLILPKGRAGGPAGGDLPARDRRRSVDDAAGGRRLHRARLRRAGDRRALSRQPPGWRGRSGQQPQRRERSPTASAIRSASRPWRRSSTSSGMRRWGSRRSIRASCATTSGRRPSI